jgi:hypothetical protein
MTALTAAYLQAAISLLPQRIELNKPLYKINNYLLSKVSRRSNMNSQMI